MRKKRKGAACVPSCEYYQALMSRLLDGDLTAEEQAAAQEHIRSCPDCARVWDAFCQMGEAIRGEAMVEPPPALARGVMDRVAAHSRPAPAPIPVQSHRLRSWKKLAAAACFVVLVAAGAVTGVFGRDARTTGGGNTASYLPEAKSETAYVHLPEDAGGSAETVRTADPADSAPGAGSALSGAADSAPLENNSAAAPQMAPEAEGTEEEAVEAPEEGIMAIMEPPQAAADSVPLALPVQGADGSDAGLIADTAALRALLTGEALDGPLPEPDYTLSLDGETCFFAGDGDGGLLWWRGGDTAPTRSPASLADLEALFLD